MGMTVEDVSKLAKVIKAYYPSIQLLNNPIEVQIWADEFKSYDLGLTLEAARNVCRRNESSFAINIHNIQAEYNDLKLKILEEKKEEERERILKIEAKEELVGVCPEELREKFNKLFGRKVFD